MSTSESIYVRHLSLLGHGRPLWDPEPTNHGEVHIGDVGYVFRGAFIRLFNAMKDADEPENIGLTLPDPFIKFDLPRKDMELYRPHAILADVLCGQTIVARRVRAGASLPGVHGRFEIKCSHDEGALLVLKDDAERREVRPNEWMKRYVYKHYEDWQSYAETVHGLHKSQDLYFVRGFVKTKEWLVASFQEGSQLYAGHVNIHRSGAGFSLAAKKSRIMFRTPEVRTGPARGTTGGFPHASRADTTRDLHDERAFSETDPDDIPSNQSIFIHYYKLRTRRMMFGPRTMEAAAEPHDLPDDSFDEYDGPAVPSSYNNSEGFVMEHDLSPKIPDPVDPLLEYILEHSHATAAIASDADFIGLCKDLDPSEDILVFLRRTLPRIEVDSSGLGAIISPGPAPDQIPSKRPILTSHSSFKEPSIAHGEADPVVQATKVPRSESCDINASAPTPPSKDRKRSPGHSSTCDPGSPSLSPEKSHKKAKICMADVVTSQETEVVTRAKSEPSLGVARFVEPTSFFEDFGIGWSGIH
ncbi:hypothetical protein CERSUDRAFT_92769 [Gelatoporia subvermispora B]|uniref:Uncharacterized protein n=1 Tax=Ceriporiopsis subvermispora (strain B) TaxID=914234 RepID=M2QNU8_CERS8|nr:hypothetical protein CERSUDRAFT_92769 [Gelatoporia subvermispora B]